MSSSWFYRIASVVLVLFAAGHTLGFRETDSRWGVEPLIASMRTIHFDVQGFDRTYYDFYVGFGLFVSVFLLLAAVLAWQLGGMSKETLTRIPAITWGLTFCFVVITFLSWRYFFIVPVVFSSATTLCLVLGTWFSKKAS